MMHSSITAQEQPSVSALAPNFAQSRSRRKTYLLLIIAVWAFLYIPGLFTPALLDDADSVHAEASREMVARGDWVTLRINNGIRYLEKAPLMYWGMGASFKVFGVSEWSARLPLALGMLALLLATYRLGRRTMGETAGLYAALALGTSFGPYIFTRILIPDILVGLWLTLGFDFFLQGLEEERPSLVSCWGLAAAAALNVLTKGLIGIVFPAGIIFLYLLLTSNLRHLLRMRLASSFAVLLAIAAPWHILAGLRNPAAGESKGFFWFYFVNEHFLRYLNKRFPKDYDTVPFPLFWGMILVWLMPWSAFLFKAFGQVPHRLRELSRGLDKAGRARLLFAIWAGVILIFFSFSSRQEYYTIPALPGLALLLGGWLADEQNSIVGSKLRKSGQRVSSVVLGIAVPLFLVAMLFLWYSEAVPPGANLSDILTKNPEKYALSFGHIFDLTPQAMGMFRLPLAASAIALLIGAAQMWWFRRKGHIRASNAAVVCMMLVFLQCAHQGLVIFEPVLSSKQLSRSLEKVYAPGDVIVINGAYEDGSTLNFYGNFQLHVLNTRTNGNLYNGSLFPDSPAIFEDNASLDRLWKSDRRIFLWTEEDKIPELIKRQSQFLIASAGGKLILSNHDGDIIRPAR
ncbi:MAG TPA: glycosyltransferase family 39 protein [Clostridia bacterium]|nr:glycosyltransferase family 39 protein [Clostridia bacterium]